MAKIMMELWDQTDKLTVKIVRNEGAGNSKDMTVLDLVNAEKKAGLTTIDATLRAIILR